MENIRTVSQLLPVNQRCLNTYLFQTHVYCDFKAHLAKMASANSLSKRKAEAWAHGSLSASIWSSQIKRLLRRNGICHWSTDCRRESVLPPPAPTKEESKPFIYKKHFKQNQEVVKCQWSGFQLISKFIKIHEANLWIKAWLWPKQSEHLSLCKDKQ